MKIAISADGKETGSRIDQRFGRCKYFIIIDSEKNKIIECVENEGPIQGHGAGIKAAEQLGKLNVECVITGNLGPNATDVLKQLEIKALHSSGTITEALEKFNKNELNEITDVAKSHSGITPEKVSSERIYFPLLENNGMDSKISGHFGHAPFFGLYDMVSKKLSIIPNNLDHTNPNKSPVDQIVEAVNPTTVFALGIGARAIQLFNEKGISLKTGDCSTVKEAVNNLSKLGSQTQSCGHEHHH